ncbi:AAPT2 [Symbiodinium sp. CCMP2592]|nr:AAPT2 [Symbiodinium sp. CCMP2592]
MTRRAKVPGNAQEAETTVEMKADTILRRIRDSMKSIGLTSAELFSYLDFDRDGVITLTDFAGLLMSFEPECSASVLSHTFQLFELHRGGLSQASFCRIWERQHGEVSPQLLRWLPGKAHGRVLGAEAQALLNLVQSNLIGLAPETNDLELLVPRHQEALWLRQLYATYYERHNAEIEALMHESQAAFTSEAHYCSIATEQSEMLESEFYVWRVRSPGLLQHYTGQSSMEGRHEVLAWHGDPSDLDQASLLEGDLRPTGRMLAGELPWRLAAQPLQTFGKGAEWHLAWVRVSTWGSANFPCYLMAKMPSTWSYISERGRRQLPKFCYSGSDNSYLYVYFCSPLAQLLVDRCVPLWLAPNLITLAGLSISCLGHALVHLYSPGFGNSCPSWVWLVLAICTFVYQTLDNMDGKQARRTGSSSPLGLFLDHGADALNIVLSSLNIMALLQLGDGKNWECFGVWAASTTPFFFATWEEYFTGSLYLGVFNGPTDGVLIVCASYLATYIHGSQEELWGSHFAFGLSRAQAMICFYAVCVLGTVLGNIKAIVTGPQRLLPSLALTGPFCAHVAGVAFCLLSPSLLEARGGLRSIFWFFGLAFLMLVSHLQLAHVCGEAYRPWLLSPLILGSLIAGWLASGIGSMFQIAVAVLAIAWLHLQVCVVKEMSDVLQIPIFTLDDPKKTLFYLCLVRIAPSEMSRLATIEESGRVLPLYCLAHPSLWLSGAGGEWPYSCGPGRYRKPAKVRVPRGATHLLVYALGAGGIRTIDPVATVQFHDARPPTELPTDFKVVSFVRAPDGSASFTAHFEPGQCATLDRGARGSDASGCEPASSHVVYWVDQRGQKLGAALWASDSLQEKELSISDALVPPDARGLRVLARNVHGEMASGPATWCPRRVLTTLQISTV